MSVLKKRMNDQKATSARSANPVVGKLSIGIPSDEPALVGPALVGHKVAKDIVFTKKTRTTEATGLVKGAKITERHVEQMLAAGITEVPVVYGSFPQRLDHFRLTRQATNHGGYVHDLDFYKRYGLVEGFTECPIILTSEDMDVVVGSRLVNYDRANKCVFCSSTDGLVARRLQPDHDNGGYLEDFIEVECVPFHDDPRKHQGTPVCEFRKHGAALPCKFSGSLSFQLLPADPEVGIPLGQYFKMDSTSAEAGSNWVRALEEVKRHFGRISFVPLKLQTVKVNTVYYDGAKRKDTQVVRTTIVVDSEYLERFKPAVDKTAERVRSYGGLLMPEQVMTDEDVAAWTAEFNPRERQKDLLEQGLVTEEQIQAEADADGRSDEAGRINRPAGGPAVFARRKDALMIRARRLPADRYQSFLASSDGILPGSIGRVEAYVKHLLADVPEDEQAVYFDINTSVSEEISSDAPEDAPHAVAPEVPLPEADDLVLIFDSDADTPTLTEA